MKGGHDKKIAQFKTVFDQEKLMVKIGSHVFLSRKRMLMLLTSASETWSLKIPPESISAYET